LFNLGESQQKRVAKPPTHVDEEPFFFAFFPSKQVYHHLFGGIKTSQTIAMSTNFMKSFIQASFLLFFEEIPELQYE